MRRVKQPQAYVIPSLLAFDGQEVTEHNRQPVSITPEKLMQEKRMVNGTLRRYVVATKRKWSISWSDTFSKAEWVVDGYMSGEEIKQFYDDNDGEFMLTITYGDGLAEEVLVMFDDFSHTVTRRTTDFDIWDFDVSLVEV